MTQKSIVNLLDTSKPIIPSLNFEPNKPKVKKKARAKPIPTFEEKSESSDKSPSISLSV